MKRRRFIALLGGAASSPVAARAQQQTLPVIGYLYTGAPETSTPWTNAFRQGLGEAGFHEGRNVAIEFRWANNEPGRLDGGRSGSSSSRSHRGTGHSGVGVGRQGRYHHDPDRVSHWWRPGRSRFRHQSQQARWQCHRLSVETGSKRLGLLHELLPAAVRFGALINPSDPNVGHLTKDLQAAAAAIQRDIEFFGATNSREIDVAFANLAQKQPHALLVSSQGLFSNRRVQIVTHATRQGLPAVYFVRDFVEVGGLMSYGSSASEQFRLTGVYAGRILKGEKPVDLPVLRASKFEFVINLQTAKIFGLDIPTTLLARADEVIE
jgi:ABC transporter substrate binding protein